MTEQNNDWYCGNCENKHPFNSSNYVVVHRIVKNKGVKSVQQDVFCESCTSAILQDGDLFFVSGAGSDKLMRTYGNTAKEFFELAMRDPTDRSEEEDIALLLPYYAQKHVIKSGFVN